jgi:hypothetical protein
MTRQCTVFIVNTFRSNRIYGPSIVMCLMLMKCVNSRFESTSDEICQQ